MADPADRGLILTTLHTQSPFSLTRVALESRMLPFYHGDTREFLRDLDYLMESGFVSTKEEELDGDVYVTYKITPAGTNIVQRRIKDVGVEMAKRQ